MRYQHFSRLCSLFLLIAALLITGCSAPAAESQPAPTQPAAQPTTAPTAAPTTQPPSPTPVEPIDKGQIEDPEEFKAALLQALMDQDTEKLQGWMTIPFITGGWRADASDSDPVDALRSLYNDYLGADNRLELVKDADLKALMGGLDPLSLPRSDAGVIEAVLVSGWGKDGRDEAILFIARAADNSLKWQGWITVNGGFSGARLGGIQLYTNEAQGYSVYLPKGYEIEDTNPGNVLIMAPGEGHPGQGRAAAFIEVVPANGRTVQEITEQVKVDVGPGFNIPPGTAMGLDKAMAIVLSGLPGQDVNRQLFVVYNDLLYHITFVPDTSQAGIPFTQMEDLYAMIVNTFHFTN